jgi:hypothetical protein
MPKKLIARKQIKDETMSSFLYYLEGWAVKTSRDRSTQFEIDIWKEALNPSAVAAAIKYVRELEDDRERLLKAEEHIKRLERACYGKCIHYSRREPMENLP